MGQDLVVLNNQAPLAKGGLGLAGSLFSNIRPTVLELVAKSTTKEGGTPGMFRNTATGEQVPSLKVVLFDVRTQRDYWPPWDPNVKQGKECFSLDNIQPHPKAKNPPALYCASCKFGDLMWEAWRNDPRPASQKNDLLPKCKMFYHLFLADRESQTFHYLDVGGKSVKPFKDHMERDLYGLIAKETSNIRLRNKERGYTFDKTTGLFNATPGFVPPPGGQLPPLPSVNLFDFSFEIYSTQLTKGGPYVMACRKFALMQEKDKQEFGALFLEYMAQRNGQKQAQQEAEEVDEAVAEESSSKYDSEVLPPVEI
jgi:hypothetical protein